MNESKERPKSFVYDSGQCALEGRCKLAWLSGINQERGGEFSRIVLPICDRAVCEEWVKREGGIDIVIEESARLGRKIERANWMGPVITEDCNGCPLYCGVGRKGQAIQICPGIPGIEGCARTRMFYEPIIVGESEDSSGEALEYILRMVREGWRGNHE